MDRAPLAPYRVQPFDSPPDVAAAIEPFARKVGAGDPMVVAFNMTPTAMVVSDPNLADCPIIYVNRAFERLTGFAAVEVLGRNCRFMRAPGGSAAGRGRDLGDDRARGGVQHRALHP